MFATDIETPTLAIRQMQALIDAQALEGFDPIDSVGLHTILTTLYNSIEYGDEIDKEKDIHVKVSQEHRFIALVITRATVTEYDEEICQRLYQNLCATPLAPSGFDLTITFSFEETPTSWKKVSLPAWREET